MCFFTNKRAIVMKSTKFDSIASHRVHVHRCASWFYCAREFLLYSFNPFANFHIEFCQKLLKLIKEKNQTRTHHQICEICEGKCDQNPARIRSTFVVNIRSRSP